MSITETDGKLRMAYKIFLDYILGPNYEGICFFRICCLGKLFTIDYLWTEHFDPDLEDYLIYKIGAYLNVEVLIGHDNIIPSDCIYVTYQRSKRGKISYHPEVCRSNR
jgi:hypothetical protein